jgi:hypothetical protein
MLFIAVEEFLAYLHIYQFINYDEMLRNWLYLPKAAAAGILLIIFRRHYLELDLHELLRPRSLLLSLAAGITISLLWINMDWTLSSQIVPKGFDPATFQEGPTRTFMIGLRCFGAIIIVPIMEELFWRSFLLRYLIDRDFMTVTIGRLTWFSVVATCLLFGLEHHYFFAGVMAGIIFSLVYSLTKSIVHCIFCHAVANLCLAIYVLNTAQWRYW